MNVSAHQEKEKNEETDKRRQKRKQAINFKEVACFPSVVVQGGSSAKNDLCEGNAWGNWKPRESQQPFRPNLNEVGTPILR